MDVDLKKSNLRLNCITEYLKKIKFGSYMLLFQMKYVTFFQNEINTYEKRTVKVLDM